MLAVRVEDPDLARLCLEHVHLPEVVEREVMDLAEEVRAAPSTCPIR